MKFLSPLIVTLLFSGLLIFGCESVVDKTDLVSDEIVQSVSDRHAGQYESCDCSYRILEVTPDDPSSTDFGLFITSSSLNECNGNTCSNFFTGGKNCENNGSCTTDLISFPSASIPFNCSVAPFRYFTTNFSIKCCSDCDPINPYISGTVVVEISCEGIEGSNKCLGGTYVTTESVYFDGSGFFNGLFEVQLTDCGCTPTIL